MRKQRWFARMGDIPGLGLPVSPGVDRSRLAGTRVRPTASEYGLSWPASGGSISQSPAQQYSAQLDVCERVADIVLRVWEGVELPGEPMDYHFLLQTGVERLWSSRRQSDQALPMMETFAFLDLALAEAAPDAVSFDNLKTPDGFVYIKSIDRLLSLLEREGAFREALSVSRRAQRFGEHYRREKLEAKISALDVECR